MKKFIVSTETEQVIIKAKSKSAAMKKVKGSIFAYEY